MAKRSCYKTKQRENLLSYLKTLKGTHVTVIDVCEYFKAQGDPIGQSTVYRHLERLVDEGVINKYIIDANSPACFEYVDKEEHCGAESCFHCKCEKCGKLIHLHCDELSGFKEHLSEHHQFKMNPMRTVFYGLCEDCIGKQEV